MENNYKLSIVLPVYQVEKYIEECVSSIFKLEDFPFELIVINDGSKDNSIKIIEELCQSKSNVKIIHQDNKGLSAARNVGLSHASGKYIWFVDSDDIISAEKAKSLIKASDNEDILIGGFKKIQKFEDIIDFNNNLVSSNIISGKYALDKLFLHHINTVVWRCMYKREFLVNNSLCFLNGVTYEDVEWTPRVLFMADKVLLSTETIYYYRLRENSIINSGFSITKCNDILKVSDSLDEFISSHRLTTHQISVFNKNSLYFLLLAYEKAKRNNLDFDYNKIFERIKRKKHKGIKYSLLILLHDYNPSLFHKILSNKFKQL